MVVAGLQQVGFIGILLLLLTCNLAGVNGKDNAGTTMGQHHQRNALLLRRLLDSKDEGIEITEAGDVVLGRAHSVTNSNGELESCRVEMAKSAPADTAQSKSKAGLDEILLKLDSIVGRCVDVGRGW